MLKESYTSSLSIKDKTAAGSFLAQFYSGIENILKRICKLRKVDLPKGELWHSELFKMFCSPAYENLPLLFDEYLQTELSAYRRFLHRIYHGYSLFLDWDTMKIGIENVEKVFEMFRTNVETFLTNETRNL